MALTTAPSKIEGGDRRLLARRGAFYLLGVIFVALLAFVAGSPIELGLRSWVSAAGGDHRIHDIMFAAIALGATAGVIVGAYRPFTQIAALQAVFVLLLAPMVVSAIAGGPFYEWGTFVVLVLVMGLVHPAGRRAVRAVSLTDYSWRLAGLVAVGAIPLLAFVFDQTTLQLASADEHAVVYHYADQAGYTLGVVLVGLLAALRSRGWWSAAALVAFVAIVQGTASVLFSTASSVGAMWGGLEVLWGVAFLAVATLERRGVLGESPEPAPGSADRA